MKNDKHESELLNSYIGKWVKVTFKDNTQCRGMLKSDGNTVKFAKSLVKKIEKI